MKKIQEYRMLQNKLWDVRDAHKGNESAEEERVLAKMDEVWKELTGDERTILNEEERHGIEDSNA